MQSNYPLWGVESDQVNPSCRAPFSEYALLIVLRALVIMLVDLFFKSLER